MDARSFVKLFRYSTSISFRIQHCRLLSSSSSSFTVNQPTKPTQSWERGAKMVKSTEKNNLYLEQIRESHDPSMQLKTLEDELKQTMGKALGKQGEKINRALLLVLEERKKIETILSRSSTDKLCINDDDVPRMNEETKKDIYFAVERYNRYIKDAEKARWELLVHRQAIGFITQNHRFVHDTFPIPDKIKLPNNLGAFQNSTDDKASKKIELKEAVSRNFGDQLDWWEKIGRWR
jgi:hypothetical protein